jgi:short-subunit dehydrogenase
MNRTPFRIVITGASSGIGAATAIAFARQGCRLVLGARGKAGLEDVARRCRAAGGTVEIRTVDVTDADAVAAFAADAHGALGGIDLWFSNVGIGVVGKYLDVPLADHRRVIEANLIGHMHDAYAVLPVFLQQGHGIWVNMISLGSYLTSPYASAYAASKFGLRGFSAALRAELHDHPRIHVCDVYPTFVDTPAIHHAGNYTGAKLGFPPGALAPERVADAVLQLARHPQATTVVGAPASALKLGELATPVTASLMERFMEAWSKRPERVPDTAGTMYSPPRGASGIRGADNPAASLPSSLPGLQDGRGPGTALALGAAALGLAMGLSLWGRRP